MEYYKKLKRQDMHTRFDDAIDHVVNFTISDEYLKKLKELLLR